MGEFYEKYFGHVFKWYEKHFHLFQEATEQALQDFKKGYLGSFADFSTQTQQEPKNKLKTNLTVKEIAYLFRVLNDEGIIDAKHKTDIFNFIAENFSSKQKEDVSVNSIKNAFDTPDFNAMDFWFEKFIRLRDNVKKDKQK
jgi:predicted metal-dependent hydrolase